MINVTMLYQHPGPHQIHGGRFDYVVVPDEHIEEKLAEGWHLTTDAAKAASDAATASAQATADDDAAPNRDELKAKAKELGLEFPANVPTSRLAEMVAHALKAV